MQTINLTSIDLDRQFDPEYLHQTVSYYEAIITQGDECSHNYWQLGLAYLLAQREVDAQATWFIPFELASELEVADLTNELSNLLDRVASQKLAATNFEDAWLIGQHLREIDLTHINNLFRSILLEIKFNRFIPEIFTEWEVVELLANSSDPVVEWELLCQLLELFLYFPSELTSEFIRQCLSSFPAFQSQSIDCICGVVRSLTHRSGPDAFTIGILEICRDFQPDNTIVLQLICRLNSDLGEHQKAIDASVSIYALCETLPTQIIGNHTIVRTLLAAGDWQAAYPILSRHAQLLELFVTQKYDSLAPALTQGIVVASPFLLCAADRPDYYRPLQNKIAKIYLEHQQPQVIRTPITPEVLPKPTGVIRIGYVGATLRSHSVGWLSRWLFQYHDREKFQIFTYCINQNSEDPFYQTWFRDRSDVSYCFGRDAAEISAQISADEIDILIDLDSLTLDTTCSILAAKPAPVQVSWLGWDATGLPTVDYFIADRYVLPANAQDYYQEKIWRLPQCYLSVAGFEVGTPTISRRSLGIPSDAIIYWSGQRGHKRHPDTVRAQMRIIKSVPGSYFLIKGDTDPTIIKEFFGKIAAEEGIEFDRFRFLGNVADEYTHRANLAIADIVLDTFPYNGATTTLETLWLGIPMVTQVGQQFAARNSYTFMLNAGISEGIAWNQQEYIDWGIKLGLDRELRMQVREKLRSGRQTAPVWNAKQFTLDMEQAYQEMWAKHLEQIDLHEQN
jgi:predicted O-linked N-acetylglucosamine transferase (SPINDLY family)